MSTLLEVSNLTVSYGPIKAVRDISFHVDKGELVTIIGANGAGKTSTLQALFGMAQIETGKILFQGADLATVPVEKKIALGMSLSPEGRRIFGALSVRDNLVAGGIGLPASDLADRIDAMIVRFPILGERIDQFAGTLSGGEQQMLAIARALMVSPKFLVLDEPSLGLAPKIVTQMFELVHQLNTEGVTILLVEQNVRKSLAIAHRAYVMELGHLVREGAADVLAKDPSIHETYLGAA